MLEELKNLKEKHLFFKLLFQIQDKKVLGSDVEEFIRLYPQNPHKDILVLKHLFNQLDTASREEKNLLIDQLNKMYLNETFDEALIDLKSNSSSYNEYKLKSYLS